MYERCRRAYRCPIHVQDPVSTHHEAQTHQLGRFIQIKERFAGFFHMNCSVLSLEAGRFDKSLQCSTGAGQSNKVRIFFFFFVSQGCVLSLGRKWLSTGHRVLLPFTLLFWSTNQAQGWWWVICCSHLNERWGEFAVDCSRPGTTC